MEKRDKHNQRNKATTAKEGKKDKLRKGVEEKVAWKEVNNRRSGTTSTN